MDKLVVLIVTPNRNKLETLEVTLKSHVPVPVTVYTSDGEDVHSKLRNAPPRLVITDSHPAKTKGRQFIDDLLTDRTLESCAILILDPPPEREIYLDELATGRVQFVNDWSDTIELNQRLDRALNFTPHGEKPIFHLRYLAEGEQLLKEGEKADFVYILKKGRLRAYRQVNGQRIDLGDINPGEFVGEMAYIHGNARNANVEALAGCELIEIPLGTLDKLLYQRPTWAKMLLLTISKRLKQANETKTSSANRGASERTSS
jgi:CRP/FNR family transcriptional regulator, cyclic AMP receptor protein